MIPASKKLDFCSLLTNYLREEGYDAHIVFSGKQDPEWPAASERYLPCVEVGFPKPSLQFMVDPKDSEICEVAEDTCFWRSVDMPVAKSSFWYPLVPIHDPDLFNNILGIITVTGSTLT